MAPRAKNLQNPPFTESLPEALYFRVAQMPADATYPRHSHAWGEFVYSYHGVMEIKLANRHYLAPPQYGIWLPPKVEHTGMNRYEAFHSSLYINEEHCGGLPATACALAVNALVRAILDHLRVNPPVAPRTASDERLLRVLVDQLGQAECVGSYLPSSEDPVLSRVLRQLEQNPADNRSLPALAHAANTTERTLIRRCQRDLGMTLMAWRQRLRVVRAMPLLEAGQSVETIALDLGYASASAFIAMFRRLMDETPDEYRRRING